MTDETLTPEQLAEKARIEQARLDALAEAEARRDVEIKQLERTLQLTGDQRDLNVELGQIFAEQHAAAQRDRELTGEKLSVLEQMKETASINLAQLKAQLGPLEKQRALLQEKKNLGITLGQEEEERLMQLEEETDILREQAKIQQKNIDKANKGLKAQEKIMGALKKAMASVYENTKSFVIAVYDAKAGLVAASGGAMDLTSAFLAMPTAILTIQEQAEAMKAVSAQMTNFSDISKKIQPVIANQAGLFNRLGVSSQTTGEIIEIGMRQMGLSGKEALNMQKQVAAAATTLGIPVSKMMDDFKGTMPKLAKFGKQAKKEFLKLAAISKKTGIGVDKLMDSMGKFDTIDGAAEAAGNLAAVLGLNINAMDMMSMSEAERAQHIKEQLEMSGKQFDNMNKMEKMAAAEAMGMDVATFQKFMEGKSDAMAQASEDAQKAQGDEFKLTKLATASETAAQKATKLKEKQALLTKGQASAMGGLIDKYYEWMGALGKIGGVITLVIGAIGGLGSLFLGMLAWFPAFTTGIATSITAVGTAAAGTLKLIGKTLKKYAKGFLAAGAAFLMMGAGLAIAAWGVAQLVLAFQGMDEGQIKEVGIALAIFGGMLVLLAIALAIAGAVGAPLVLLAFGAAFLMIGGAVYLAALGFIEILKVLPAFLEEIKDNIGTLIDFALLLYPLGVGLVIAGYGLAVFGVAALIAVPGLLGLAVAMLIFSIPLLLLAEAFPRFMAGMAPHVPIMGDLAVGIGKMALAMGLAVIPMGLFAGALAFIKTDDLVAIARMAEGFSEFAKNITNTFVEALKAIGEFVDAVDAIGSSNVEVFARLRQEVVPLLTTTPAPGIGKELKSVAIAAKDYAKANAELKVDADDDAIVALIKAVKGGGGGGGNGVTAGAGGGGNTIILQLNGREFARAVDVAINDGHNITMKS